MDRPCLNDPDQYPDDEVLGECLRDARKAWDAFVGMLAESYPAFTREWRYYRDGKSWLYKVTKKTKTICWVSVWPHAFKVAFYLPERAEELIVASRLKKEYVERFLHGRRYGTTRSITVIARKPTDLPSIKKLIGVKEQLK